MITAALAALGISTKVAAAATAGVIAVGGLGVAGAAIVDRAPEEVPVVEAGDGAPETVRQDADRRQDAEAPVDPTEEVADAAVEPVAEGDTEGDGPPEDSFGARVSADAQEGGVDGLDIAAEAQANAAARAEARQGPPADLPVPPADVPGPPADVPGPPADIPVPPVPPVPTDNLPETPAGPPAETGRPAPR
ncbi:hypothetical protein [Rhabdothermincola salaria]|uniref:hypothetical protein n=1 Tax=Rhabdothermincola salaria TaxID=2903142 RepID=UPI001E286A16|nr:hypothetical protein [Rhabdothermincola salaria]MCD9623633.1 hypothetical protein [Rhabdothermincola salaria]